MKRIYMMHDHCKSFLGFCRRQGAFEKTMYWMWHIHGYVLIWALWLSHIYVYESNTEQAPVKCQPVFHFISLQLHLKCFVRCHVSRIIKICDVLNGPGGGISLICRTGTSKNSRFIQIIKRSGSIKRLLARNLRL